MRTRHFKIAAAAILPILAGCLSLLAYDITGTTLAKLAEQFNAGGSGYAGLTSFKVGRTYSYKTTSSACPGCDETYSAEVTVEEAKISLETKIEVPNWTNKSDACAKIQEEWDRFFEALQNA